MDGELDHKESWVPKNRCSWTVVLEGTLESPLNCKINPITPKGNQSWIFTGRTDAEAEILILWPPDVKNWLIRKDLMLAKIEGRRRGHRGRDGWMASPTQWTWVWASSGKWWGQGDLACCSPWGCKELDMTEQLNGTDKVPASSVKWYSVGGRGLSVVVYKYYKLQNNY